MRLKFLMQQAIDQADDSGGYSRDWVDMGFIWGKFKNSSGMSGSYQGSKLQFKSYNVDLFDANNSGISIGWRLECEGVNYEVTRIFRSNKNITQVSLRSLK